MQNFGGEVLENRLPGKPRRNSEDNININFINTVWKVWDEWIRIILNGKREAIPVQAWTGPEGSRRLRLPDFKTVGTLRW